MGSTFDCGGGPVGGPTKLSAVVRGPTKGCFCSLLVFRVRLSNTFQDIENGVLFREGGILACATSMAHAMVSMVHPVGIVAAWEGAHK